MDPTLPLGGLIAVSCAYSLAALVAVGRFRRRPLPSLLAPADCPGVSILKPAAGAGPEFEDLLRSFATQEHPDFEILVGAGSADEEVRNAVRIIQAEFPHLRIIAVDCTERSTGSNEKVEALEALALHARKPVWVVSDADIRVPSEYLRAICTDLGRPNAGLVTCLYRARTGSGLASRLERLWINAEFPCQVLLARWLQGTRFALGATLAFKRETLEEIGGFGTIRQFIGDDYQLGNRIAATGLAVKISSVVVVTELPSNDGWRDVWRRQVRWSRTIRMQRPMGHAGLFVGFGSIWALLAMVIAPSAWWPLAVMAFVLKAVTAAVASSQVGCRGIARSLWLLPACDLASCAVWLWSFAGRTVKWADRAIRLGSGGRILY